MNFKKDKLLVSTHMDRIQMGRASAKDVAKRINQLLVKQESVRIIFAAAPSQDTFLEELTKSDVDWTRVIAFQMDEYIGLPPDHSAAFQHYLDEHLMRHIPIGSFFKIDVLTDPEQECKRYGSLVLESSIDIVCFGIGENGHIAFNDPGVADFRDPLPMKVVELDANCRMQQVHDGCFPNMKSVPTHALTLTIPTLLSGKYLFGNVPGIAKRKAVQKTLYEPISLSCPSTILRTHESCRLYLDADALGDYAYGH